jgi:G3E family GTPase
MFLNRDTDQQRLPAVLLSGFLGSGKTTLVNRLLRDPRLADTAVAINEFGDVPLDQQLMEHAADSTLVLANGCLCCRLAGDFEDAVMRMFSRRQTGALPRFARLIVELSGLADPAPIAQAILRNPVMSRALRLTAIIATADAVLVEGQLARYPETAKQIALADRLVLTKTDMADAAAEVRVAATLRRFNPLAPILRARQGAIDAAELLPRDFLQPSEAASPIDAWISPSDRRSTLRAEHVDAAAAANHADATQAVSLVADTPLRWRAFDTWLRGIRIAHAAQLLRVKGLLNVAESSTPIVIQGVEHVVHPPVALDRWPDQDRRTRIVLITRGLPHGTIQASWAQALPALLATTPPADHPAR